MRRTVCIRIVWLAAALCFCACQRPTAASVAEPGSEVCSAKGSVPDAKPLVWEDYFDPPAIFKPELMQEQRKIDNWVYFLYPTAQELARNAFTLCRRREDGSDLTRLAVRCDAYTVIDDCVYYADFPLSGREHGVLYVIQPEQEPQVLADEVASYQIAGDSIYYGHSFDTIGVGIEGHALHRIDLDGSNHIIAAYETIGPELQFGGHIGRIADGYVYYENYRIKLGSPADGTEEVQLLSPVGSDDGWLYYSTNRLIKAQPDGSRQIILDGDATSYISITKIEGDWIYYTDYSQIGFPEYKIRKDGTGKTERQSARW